MSGFRTMQGKAFTVFLVCMGLLIFVYKVGDRDLWAPDEDEYAQISREMIRSNTWAFPTCNGEPWTVKPPLYSWLTAAVSLPFGDVNEFRARIFSALGGLGVFLLTFYLGRRAFSPLAGLLAALVLATNILFLQHARWAQTYALSAFFATLAICLFYRGYTEPEKRTVSYLLMYAAVGLGVLTMGPVNLVMPGLVVFFYLVAMRDLKHVTQMRLGWGILISGSIMLPWYVMVAMGEGYGSEPLVRTNLTRFFSTWTHKRPFYYYLTGIPWGFLPWSFLLPAALHLSFSRRSRDDRKAVKFILVWFITLLLFFSLAQAKRNQYILAVYPAMALLVGYLGDRAVHGWSQKYFRRAVIIPSLLLLVLSAVMAVALPVWTRIYFEPLLAKGLGAASIFGAFAVLLGVALRRNQPRPLLFLPAGLTLAILLYGLHVLVPAAEHYKSPRAFCDEIAVRLEKGGQWAMFRFYRAAYVYYTDSLVRVLETESELRAFLAEPTFSMVAMPNRHYDRLSNSLLADLPVITRRDIGHRTMVLVANRQEP